MANGAETFKAACVQMRSGLDRAQNTRDACALIETAAEAGAQFIATPEMTNVVDAKGSRLLADLPGEDGLAEIAAFSAAAKAHGVWLLIGSLAVREGEKAANRSFLFGPDGGVIARYDKLHMFDVDLPNGESWKESKVYNPGSKSVIAKTPLAAFGLTICYDLRFSGLYRLLCQNGAEVLCAPAAFTRQTGTAHWHALLRSRAIENGAFVIAPGQGGLHEDGRETFGHSMIIDPWGEILAEADHDQPGIVCAEIDCGRVREARQRIPNLALEREFEITIINQ